MKIDMEETKKCLEIFAPFISKLRLWHIKGGRCTKQDLNIRPHKKAYVIGNSEIVLKDCQTLLQIITEKL